MTFEICILLSFSRSAGKMEGHDNPTFEVDSVYTIYDQRKASQFYPGKHDLTYPRNNPTPISHEKTHVVSEPEKKASQERDSWGKGIEFLLSCIAMR